MKRTPPLRVLLPFRLQRYDFFFFIPTMSSRKMFQIKIKTLVTRQVYGLTQRVSVVYSLMSALMTRQALIRVVLAVYQKFTGKPDE